MREAELRLEQQLGDVRRLTMERTIQEKLRLEAAERLLPERIETLLRFEQQRLERAEEVVESRSPQQILKLGFAILRGEERAIRTTEELKRHTRLKVELSDGTTEINLKK